jgi:hypothetical protein
VVFHGSGEPGDLREFYAPNTTYGCSPKCNGGGLFDGSQPSARFPYNGKVSDYQCFDKREHSHVQTTMTAVLASSEGIPPHSGKYVIKAVHHNYCKNNVHDSKGVGGPGCFSGDPGCSCNAHGQDPRSRKTDAAGTRLFRWLESADPKYFESGLYYGIWAYFPQNYAMNRTSDSRFFNLIQMKAAIPGAANDPVWAIDVVNQTPLSVSPMRLVVGFNGHGPAAHPFLGPHANSNNINHRFDLESSSPPIPIGKWFHIQIYLKQWPREVKPHRGRIAVWQDDKLLVDVGGPDDSDGGIWTKYGDDLDGSKKEHGSTQFSVNNYTNGAIPDPAVIYFDDMVISTAPIYPGTSLGGKSKK